MRKHSRIEHPYLRWLRAHKRPGDVLQSSPDRFPPNNPLTGNDENIGGSSDPLADGNGIGRGSSDPFGQGASQFGGEPTATAASPNIRNTYTRGTPSPPRETPSVPARAVDHSARLWQGPVLSSSSLSPEAHRTPSMGQADGISTPHFSLSLPFPDSSMKESLAKTFFQFLSAVTSHVNPAASRGPAAVVDRGLQSVFRMVGSSNLSGLSSQLQMMGLQGRAALPGAPSAGNQVINPSSASSTPTERGSKVVRTPEGEAVPERVLSSLSFLMQSPGVNPALKQVLSQSVAKWMGLPLEELLSGLSLKDSAATLKTEPWRPFLAPLGEKAVMGHPLLMGLVFTEIPGLKSLIQIFNPIFRIFLGGMFLNGPEVDLKNFHSILLDEIGALMARRTRRHRRRERKRLSRSDRVTAKDQSLPIDTHTQEEDEEAFFEIESWLQSQTSSDVTSFLWN